MKLSEYLYRNNLSLGELAKRCGTSASTILRMKEATVAPSKRVAEALWQATDGQVTPNDLFGLHYADGKCTCLHGGNET
jgi:hypothetical protein